MPYAGVMGQWPSVGATPEGTEVGGRDELGETEERELGRLDEGVGVELEVGLG